MLEQLESKKSLYSDSSKDDLMREQQRILEKMKKESLGSKVSKRISSRKVNDASAITSPTESSMRYFKKKIMPRKEKVNRPNRRSSSSS